MAAAAAVWQPLPMCGSQSFELSMLNGTALNYLDLTGAQPFLPTDKGTSSPPRQSGRIHPLQRLSDFHSRRFA